ncbi:hypothetical protein [Staphylococcus sp. 17KM0847]|uniref:hypothetical protein n=1 Tax=Staphylococcus sp. 17KM0847 TaxID=2583989 RepID=UPI0015DBF3DC|nr:hypothetical protein [Staphylococcus sp. 17KM0847]QLK86726.1 hypothetical protein FGL66_08495 [Staphylococcus sp. 17KM0847]
MRRLFTGLFALTLVLAACSNDDSSSKSSKEKDTNATQTEQTQKDTQTKHNEDVSEKDDAQQQSEENSNSTTAQSSDSSKERQDQPAATQNDQQASVQTHVQSDQSKNQAEANEPHQGQNVVPIAQNLVRVPIDEQQALQTLPNFQDALNKAQAEVDQFNGYQNPYNDYALEGEDGFNMYIFSFLNQANPGTYTIVTVDESGTPKIVDPAYRQ